MSHGLTQRSGGRRITLRLTRTQHSLLTSSLQPVDGYESACVVLCGRAGTDADEVLCVHSIHPVPSEQYVERTGAICRWRTEWAISLLLDASKRGLAVCKIHSHRSEVARFSDQDLESEREWFRSIAGWFDDDRPHLNVVLLPSGKLLLRDSLGATAQRVTIVGDEINVSDSETPPTAPLDESSTRERMVLGDHTVRLLGRLTIAVIGASGTGSIVAEQCARLGVGSLLLVDPKELHRRNVGRILHSTVAQSHLAPPKVLVLKEALESIGLGCRVTAVPRSMTSEAAVRAVSCADVVIGCTDSHLARNILNRLSTYYLIPYIDCGVRVDVDKDGEVKQVSSAVHFCAPDGSWLSDRGVTSVDAARAESLAANSPDEFARLLERGYVRGMNVDRPAVISFNMIAAALAMNELLSRLHRFREDGNQPFRSTRVSLTQVRLVHDSEEHESPDRSAMLGRGDRSPLLGLTGLNRWENPE